MESIITIENLSMDKDSVTFTHIMIEVNDDSGLGAATLNLSYNPEIIQILHINNENFDSIIYNIDNNAGFTNIVTYQTGQNGVGPGLIKFADIELIAIGEKGSETPLFLEIVTLKNNTGISIPYKVINGKVSIKIDKQEESIKNSDTNPQMTIDIQNNETKIQSDENQSNQNNLNEEILESPKLITNQPDETQKSKVDSTPGFSSFFSILSFLLLVGLFKLNIFGSWNFGKKD
jgi:hypothetical protein